MAQLLWFVTQLVTRLCKRLPTTLLEIMTLSFALCSAIAYILLLDKPKDAAYAIVVPASRRPATAQDLARLSILGPGNPVWRRSSVWIPNNALPVGVITGEQLTDMRKHIASSLSFTVASSILGATHCIAWNFTFPTETERLLWNASSIITATFILASNLAACVLTLILLMLKIPPEAQLVVAKLFELFASAFFVAARVFTLVEVFRSLAYLPPNAFQTTWSSNLPHIGG